MVCRAIRCALLFRLIVKTSCKGRGFRPGAPCRYSWGRSDVRQMVFDARRGCRASLYKQNRLHAHDGFAGRTTVTRGLAGTLGEGVT